jgi:hypothetical protein
MTSKDREERLNREKGKALVRDLHESELRAAGAARAVALYEADQQLDRIARLLPDALEGGLSLTEVARITKVSRPTLYELRAKYGGSPGDLRLAVLQTVATRAPIWESEVVEHLGGRDEAAGVLVSFWREGLLDIDPPSDDPDLRTGPGYEMTAKGYETLENWTFALEVDGEEAE